jgi:hypothetical protein
VSFVAIAIGGSAIIGAGAAIASGNKAAGAQRDATQANSALQEAQTAEARRQYDLSREDLAPYRQAGTTALGQLATGTADGGEFNRNFTLADFNKDPGYDFRQQQGQRGVEASAAARGGVLSGGAMKALTRYNQDFASNEYGAAYNRFNNDTTTRFNRLSSLAGTGQTATNSGIAAGNEMINQGQTGVNNLAAGNQSAANARASSYINTGNAIGNAAGQIGNALSMRNLYSGGGYGGGNSIANRFSSGIPSGISRGFPDISAPPIGGI